MAVTNCSIFSPKQPRTAAREEPDDRHRWLLRARRERPRHGAAAEQRDERAAPYAGHRASSPASAPLVYRRLNLPQSDIRG
jgi:hypothetical protein